MTTEEKGRFKECVYCRTEIDFKATVCSTCHKSQNRLANSVIWLSGAVGLLAFIGSALLFLYAAAVSQYERVYGADIEVRNVSSMKTLTVFNNSSTPVLIENAEFIMPGGNRLGMIVDRSLLGGAVGNYDLADFFRKQTTGPFLKRFGKEWAGAQVFLKEVQFRGETKETDVAKIAERLSNADYGPNKKGQNYTVEAINMGGHDYFFFGGSKARYFRMPCKIIIRYRVVRGRSFSLEPPCIGVVKYRKAEPAD